MGRELLGALREAAADAQVRAVLITGAGRAFCAGADVKVPRELTPDGEPDLHTRLEEIYNPIVLELRTMPKPAVAGVHGACAGLGFSLALACDMIVAAESARFLLAFSRIAVMPDGGALTHLAARIGAARTNELAMLAEPLGAAQAATWGVINEVVPDVELPARAATLAAHLAEGPTVAFASIKRALSEARPDLAAQLRFEAELQQRHGATADYAEGVAAFKEKRPTRFSGR